jgi:dTDP-4-amino-4,6-dideoxygalactose transaminase
MVSQVIERGMHWAIGPEIELFEKEVSDFIGTKCAVAFNSGTSALHALMISYGFKQKDEIVVPSFTFIATANSALFVGAKPIFADIEDETFGLDENNVLEGISRKTKAVMPIHYGGLACKGIKAFRDIAEDYGIVLIEDGAEALGARIKGENVGTFGDSSMFSFCANKIITTGEGGMVLTDSEKLCKKLKLIRSHGRIENESYFMTTKTQDYITLGYNWRMPTMIAALGLAQMKKLNKIITKRTENAEYLTNKLVKIDDIIPPHPPDGFFHVYQMYTIRVKGGRNVRDKLKEYLAKKAIMSKVYFEPVHLTPFYRKTFRHKKSELKVTEKIANEVLTLPMYPELTRREMDYMVESIKEFFRTS